jgi:hypothetical protein
MAPTRDAQQTLAAIVTAGGDLDSIATQVAAAIEQQSAATAAIAGAVDSASAAARHTAGRLDGVTAASDRCTVAVADMNAISQDVARQMKELKAALSALLHARVAELDRRTGVRVAVRLPARLEYAGGVADGELHDLSTGGARFCGVAPGASAGRLVVAGLPPIDAIVVVTDADGLHLAFTAVSEEQRTRIGAILSQAEAVRPAA